MNWNSADAISHFQWSEHDLIGRNFQIHPGQIAMCDGGGREKLWESKKEQKTKATKYTILLSPNSEKREEWKGWRRQSEFGKRLPLPFFHSNQTGNNDSHTETLLVPSSAPASPSSSSSLLFLSVSFIRNWVTKSRIQRMPCRADGQK